MVEVFQIVETANQSHQNRLCEEKRDYIRANRLYPVKTLTIRKQGGWCGNLWGIFLQYAPLGLNFLTLCPNHAENSSVEFTKP
jgi:hypothetical protein